MKIVTPDYYSGFRCIAGACRHSCCVGWEIDIDPDSLKRFAGIGGDMGRRLRENIETSSDGAHFKMGADERCPFLNREGLCDLITELGEESLCDICADHPRFRNYFSDRTEIGLGLCCEEAARLVLTRTGSVRLIVDEDGEPTDENTEDERDVLSLRSESFAIMQDREQKIPDRLEFLADNAEFKMPSADNRTMAKLFLSPEQLDPDWTAMLSALERSGLSAEDVLSEPALRLPLEQLTVYLLYRHLPPAAEDGLIAERVALCILLTRLAAALTGLRVGEPLTAFVDTCRMLSSEVEYSDENIDILLEYLSENLES